jgi:nucleoside phosphorylase
MRPRRPSVFFTSDLHAYGIGNTSWFDENSPRALAGRCLLDALEYLRTAPKYAAADWHRVNATTIRLVHHCLKDAALNRVDVLDRLTPEIEATCAQLLASRRYRIPFYGDDFWDWASVVDALCEVQTVSPSAMAIAARELEQFRRSVQIRLPGGLSIGDPDRERYGPATAARAYRLLNTRARAFDPHLRDGLQAQALQKIDHGRYRGREVSSWQLTWHYGQVVSEFQRGAIDQASQLADFSWLSAPIRSSDRALVLARVLHAGYAVKDRRTVSTALAELYRGQTPARPLGQGLIGASVEGSLDVLEALWPQLDEREKAALGAMLDALLFLHAKANTIGFVVSAPEEIDHLIAAMGHGTRIEQRNATRAVVRHPGFHAVICQGESLAEAASACAKAITEHGARWVIMPGSAEALGPTVQHETNGVHFAGAGAGDLVIATSLAPFRIRDKVQEVLGVADPPFPGSGWMIIPTDPELCRLAHNAAESLGKDLRVFFEGMIVTRGNQMSGADEEGIMAAFPGALAVEATGYMTGLTCLGYGTPCLNICGLVRKAGEELSHVDADRRRKTAPVAFRLAVKVAELLGRRW